METYTEKAWLAVGDSGKESGSEVWRRVPRGGS